MIDVKSAVKIAQEKASEMLGPAKFSLEEIERDSYKGRDVWSITLSMPKTAPPTFAELSADPLKYKRFLIDSETGELLAMKLREFASR